MVPTTRKEFKNYCLRSLGAPVLRINVDDDQVEDRIDEALSYYSDYHYDATETIYFKYQITEKNWPDAVLQVTVKTAGDGNTSHKYANGELLTFSGSGEGANGYITTDTNGQITSVTMTDHGRAYPVAPTVTVNTVSGQGAVLQADLGGFIEIPDSIIGVVRIFDLSSSMISHDMFSVQYQIALNDIWSLSSYSMIPYYTTVMHLNLIQQLLVGQQPIRYQRHRNRLYIDMNWDRLNPGRWVVGECYQKIDPNEFPDVWGDRWLYEYTTALIKRQWGNHMKKFGNQALPSGIMMNGQQIYDEAEAEIKKLREEMIWTYSIPANMMMG